MSERFHYSPTGDDNGRREGVFDSIFVSEGVREEIEDNSDAEEKEELLTEVEETASDAGEDAEANDTPLPSADGEIEGEGIEVKVEE